MLTYTIKGPKAEAAKAASRIASIHQIEGKVVRQYPDQASVPDEIPPGTQVVIITEAQ